MTKTEAAETQEGNVSKTQEELRHREGTPWLRKCAAAARDKIAKQRRSRSQAPHTVFSRGSPCELPQETAGHPGDVAYKASPRHRAGPKSGNGSRLDAGRTQHAGSPIGMESQSFERTYSPTFT